METIGEVTEIKGVRIDDVGCTSLKPDQKLGWCMQFYNTFVHVIL